MPGKAINKNDARYLSTQSLLEDTMLQLIRKEGFQKITVRQIVSEAGLQEFFHHYSCRSHGLSPRLQNSLYQLAIAA